MYIVISISVVIIVMIIVMLITACVDCKQNKFTRFVFVMVC